MIEKDIPEFPGYTVTDEGQIISYKFSHPKIMKTWIQKGGYENIKLCKNNETYHFLVHRLIAKVFIPNPNNLPEVNHKNKIRADNRVENLEWCSRIDNLYDSYSTMSPTRNFIKCLLLDSNGEIIGTFDSKLAAGAYASAYFGCSESSLRKYGRSKGYSLQEV